MSHKRRTNTRLSGTEPLTGTAAATEGLRGRAAEAGLNTDSRGGRGSAREAGRAGPEVPATGIFDEQSTEPRAGTRSAKPSSQGLAGAPGSGGGAERGVNQPAPRGRATAERSGRTDNSGIDPTETGRAGPT